MAGSRPGLRSLPLLYIVVRELQGLWNAAQQLHLRLAGMFVDNPRRGQTVRQADAGVMDLRTTLLQL